MVLDKVTRSRYQVDGSVCYVGKVRCKEQDALKEKKSCLVLSEKETCTVLLTLACKQPTNAAQLLSP